MCKIASNISLKLFHVAEFIRRIYLLFCSLFAAVIRRILFYAGKQWHHKVWSTVTRSVATVKYYSVY